MARCLKNDDFSNPGLVSERFLELRSRPALIALQASISGIYGGYVLEAHRSPRTQVVHRFGGQAPSMFRSFPVFAIELRMQIDNVLQRFTRTPLILRQSLPGIDPLMRVALKTATLFHRLPVQFLVPSSGLRCWLGRSADQPLLNDSISENHVRNFSARSLPDQGSQKNQNQLRRLFRALKSPVRRLKRMSQNEENHVNQRFAIRREPDCDRRR